MYKMDFLYLKASFSEVLSFIEGQVDHKGCGGSGLRMKQIRILWLKWQITNGWADVTGDSLQWVKKWEDFPSCPVMAGTSAAGFLCVPWSSLKGRIKINTYNQIIRHLPLISSHTLVHVCFGNHWKQINKTLSSGGVSVFILFFFIMTTLKYDVWLYF